VAGGRVLPGPEKSPVPVLLRRVELGVRLDAVRAHVDVDELLAPPRRRAAAETRCPGCHGAPGLWLALGEHMCYKGSRSSLMASTAGSTRPVDGRTSTCGPGVLRVRGAGPPPAGGTA